MAESLFAEILLGEKASKAMVSLDLKEKEHGARAILGIALCKDIINGPAPPDDWFDELEDMATWSTVRTMLPMWKFFLEIDNKRWKNVLRDMESVECVDANLILRLAAVHSIENPTEPFAQDVSEKAMAAFISSEQLAMISEIVNLYGIAALPKSGFIEKYILADIAYRKARGEVFGNNPPENIELQSRFRDIAKTFSSALAASDTDQFNSLHDDCSYMEGLSLFYASEFESAVKAFEKSSNTNQSERAVWMAIVCLEKIKVKTSENILQEKQLIEKYLTMWPHTRRSTELLLLQSNEKEADPQFVDDLLAVPYSDPNYERSQREAARQLYKAWRITKHSDKSVVGNKYVSVAIVLMNSDIDNVDDLSIQRAAVRALRLLEISLHRDVKRLVASEQAFEVLNRVRKGGRFDINQYLQELTYRQVIYDLLRGSNQAAISIAMEMISLHPDSPWSTKSAKSIWNTMSEEDSSPKLVYAIGAQVLRNVSDDLIASEQYVDLSKVTAEAGFEYSQAEDDNAVGEDALRIARILIKAYPKSLELLQLNAMIEHSLGEKVASLNHWRAIVTGSVQGSSDWLSAKYEVVKLVATDSPKEALRIIEQLHTIYPNYGGAPYGPMLKELHDDLRGHND
jgi:tetratricopeptide (TPR) repeat protein